MKLWQNARNKQTNMPARKEERKERGKERQQKKDLANKHQMKKEKQERALVMLTWKRVKMDGRRKENNSGKRRGRKRGREREWQRNAYAAGGELKGLAGERWGKISSTDNSIRDLTPALIIA